MGIEQFDQLGEIGQGACQAINFIDDNDIDPASSNVIEELLQGRAVGGSAGEAAIVISGSNQCPTSMSLAADIGLCRIMLGIKRVEVLIEAGLGRDPGIDGAADRSSRRRRARPGLRRSYPRSPTRFLRPPASVCESYRSTLPH